MKKKIFAILFLTTIVVNFFIPTSSESLDVKPEITNVQPKNFGI